MTDVRSMLFAQSGDQAALQKLSDHAFLTLVGNVVEEGFGSIDLRYVANTLAPGEGLFIDTLSTLGATQEAVVEALELLVVRHGIWVFVLDDKRVTDVTPGGVRLIQQFQRLDVILINRTAD